MARNSYFIVSKELAADKTISATAKLLLAALLEYRNKKTGQCNPWETTLATALATSKRTVIRCLKELEDTGWIQAKRTQRGNRYEFPKCQLGTSESGNVSLSKCQLGTSDAPVSLYEPSLIEPNPIEPAAAASSGIDTEPLAAAQKHKKKPTQNAPAPTADAGTFQIVREWLYALAPLVHLPPPDDDLVRAVIAAARGAPAKDITATLVALYKAGHLRNMRSWGFIPLKIGDCARRATA